MSLLVIMPPIAVALHLLIAVIRRRRRPAKALLLALLIIALAYPLQFAGVVLGLNEAGDFNALLRLFLYAPALAAVLSFLVYVPALAGKSGQTSQTTNAKASGATSLRPAEASRGQGE